MRSLCEDSLENSLNAVVSHRSICSPAVMSCSTYQPLGRSDVARQQRGYQTSTKSCDVAVTALAPPLVSALGGKQTLLVTATGD
jgi:hypothetical protein